MRVSEVFGPTLQGEGPQAGTPAMFVRLWGCNLDCSWCDTPYTWDVMGKNGRQFPRHENMVDEDWETVTRRILDTERDDRAVDLLVITGGEPLIQADDVDMLVEWWVTDPARHRPQVEIETNGTRPLVGPRASYNVSPKLHGSGVSQRRAALHDDVIARYADPHSLYDIRFKFVITNVVDLIDLSEFVHTYEIDPTDVWLMPEGRTSKQLDEHLPFIADEAVAKGYHLSDRLHVRVWGDKRGH